MKINDKNLATFATSGTQIDKEGYLMKKGDGHKSYAKRWFVLKGNLLFYFDKKTDREPLGVIILEGSTIELAESEMDEHYCFKIVFPSRSYILSAESYPLMEQWMKCLACASYDYVKLMAAELQRQLNELNKKPVSGEKSSSFPVAGELLSHDPKSAHQPPNSKPAHVPTPPPRSKNGRNNHKPIDKKTFESIHKEFGGKIVKDQERRWALLADKSSTKIPVPHPQLSVLPQNTLVQL